MLPTCLITALPPEARPLISYFGMRALSHSHLRLYQGDHGYLLQCGVGKLNAAACTAAMLQVLPDIAAIINVGIAGSDQPIGTTCIAHGVQDQASARQWFPHLPAVRKLPEVNSVQIVSVDQPSTNYTNDRAFDMEASGIYSAATKVLDLSFIHSVKVISDNKESGITNVTGKLATDCVEAAIPTVEKLLQALPFNTLPETKDVDALCLSLTSQIHYTTTEQHTLNQLVHRYKALFNTMPDENDLLCLGNAKSIRKNLLSEIDNAKISY